MKKIIICPFSYHKNILYDIRKKDPFLDVKLIDKSELLNAYYGNFNDKAILYIMKNYHVNFELAKIYLSYLPKLNKKNSNYKVDKLIDIKNDLIAHDFYSKDDMFLKLIENQKVDVMGYSKKDKQLAFLLDDANFILNNKSNEALPINIYQGVEEEVHGLMIDICDLLSSGVDINDIYIYGADNDYISTLIRYAKLYNLPINGLPGASLLDTEFGKQFFNLFLELKDVDQVIEKLNKKYVKLDDKGEEKPADPNYLMFRKEVTGIKEKIFDVELDDVINEEEKFEIEYDLFKNLLDIKVDSTIYNNAIRLISKPTYLKDKHIFIIGFRQATYPGVKLDNGYLSDSILDELGLPTSKDENIVKKDVMLNFLYSDNHFHYSFALKTPSGPAYLSYLMDNINLIKTEKDIPMHDYNIQASQIEYLKMRDVERKYAEIKKEKSAYNEVDKLDFDYFNYDNQFTPIDIYDKDSKITLSYSAANDFINCPFSYFLNRVLKVYVDEEKFNMHLGSFAHKIFEQGIKDPSKSFEDLYDFYITSKYYAFNEKERILVDVIKPQLKTALIVARKQQAFLASSKFYTEEKIECNLQGNSIFKGSIDKLITTDDMYATLVDYKTGKDKFSPKEVEKGFSLQLPAYCYLCAKSEKFSDLTIGGVFINNVICDDLTVEIENPNEPKFLRLNGKLIEAPSYVGAVEPGILANREKGVFMNAGPGRKPSKKEPDPPLFDNLHYLEPKVMANYATLMENYYQQIDTNIKNNNFKISPYFKKDDDHACKYCKFKDICYHTNNQYRHLLTSKEEEDMEGDDHNE